MVAPAYFFLLSVGGYLVVTGTLSLGGFVAVLMALPMLHRHVHALRALLAGRESASTVCADLDRELG